MAQENKAAARIPVYRPNEILTGLVGDLALKEYVVQAVEMEDDIVYTIFARSEAQAVRIAIRGLELFGEIHIYTKADWDTKMLSISIIGQLAPEPNIYNGKIKNDEDE